MTAPDIEAGAIDPDRRRKSRPRPSSIDALPPECDEDVAWANAELREPHMPQTEILREFNARIADKGCAPITKSAFSRHSVSLAVEVRKMDAARQIQNAILERLAPSERSDGTIAATELIKYRILEMVMSLDEPDPKLLGVATLALQRLSTTAAREAEVQRRERKDQREDADREAEQAAQLKADADAAAQAADAATRIAGDAGLSADRIAAIRRGVLGLAG